MKRSRYVILLATLLLGSTLLLAACSGDGDGFDDEVVESDFDVDETDDVEEPEEIEETVDEMPLDEAVFQIVNTSGDNICGLFVSPSSDAEFGDNILPEVLAPGESFIFDDFDPGLNDLAAINCDESDDPDDFLVEQINGIELGSQNVIWQIDDSVTFSSDPIEIVAPEQVPAPIAVDTDALGDVRIINIEGQDTHRLDFSVTIEDDDISMLVSVNSSELTGGVFLKSITDPNGVVLYDIDFSTNDVTSDIYSDVVTDNGELSVSLPSAPRFDIIPGDYQFKFESDDVVTLDGARAIIRSGDPDGPQAIDINYWIASDAEARLYDPGFQANMGDLLRAEIDRVLNPHDMQVGAINFFEASDENKERFSITQMNSDGTELPAVCRAVQRDVGNTRALNIAMVEQIVDAPDEEAEETLPDTVTAGVAVGLPGSILTEDATRSCVLTALDGFYDFSFNEQGLTSFHEAAHLMGMSHTSEQTGDYFDILNDTAECRVEEFDTNGDGFVDELECQTVDVNNFLFWGEGGPELSADQSWVLRRHPLFYPIN